MRRASSPAELKAAAAALGLGAGEVLVQQPAIGPLAMVQAVIDDGRLAAFHANLRVREGVGGGASIKESVALPTMPEHIEALARALRWRGPLSMDVILTRDGPVVIDVNPRLVEPMNAYLAEVRSRGRGARTSREEVIRPRSAGRAGVRSHQTLLAVLGAAQRQETRTAVARELYCALAKSGDYATSVEELTPISGDPLAGDFPSSRRRSRRWRGRRCGAP